MREKKTRRSTSNRVPEDTNACTERDVLMGRGKSVSEWPGNVFFRQVVNEYRDAYLLAYRLNKVNIAQEVLKKVQKNGGRFMTEDEDHKWVEVDHARALEKCCQALREKERPNPSDNEVSSIAKKRPRSSRKTNAPAATTKATRVKAKATARKKAVTKSKRNKKKASPLTPPPKSEDDESDVTDDSSASSLGKNEEGEEAVADAEGGSDSDTGSKSSEDEEDDSLLSSSKKKYKGSSEDQPRNLSPGGLVFSPIHRVRISNSQEMVMKLESFVKVAGHCAVPPGWESDPVLADWCTVLRQEYRSHKVGLLDESEREEKDKLFKTLDGLNFVWDYEAWHWDHQFERFVMSYDKDGVQVVDNTEWLDDQRSQWVEYNANLTSDRVEKLKAKGISLA